MCSTMGKIENFKFHRTAAWTFQRIVVEGKLETENPALHEKHRPAQMAFPEMEEITGMLIGQGIKAVIAEHVEALLRNMDDQFLNEIVGVFGLVEDFRILMALVPVSHVGAVVGRDAGLCHDRPADISGDVFGNRHRGVKIFFCRRIDVEPVGIGSVKERNQGMKL